MRWPDWPWKGREMRPLDLIFIAAAILIVSFILWDAGSGVPAFQHIPPRWDIFP